MVCPLFHIFDASIKIKCHNKRKVLVYNEKNNIVSELFRF